MPLLRSWTDWAFGFEEHRAVEVKHRVLLESKDMLYAYLV